MRVSKRSKTLIASITAKITADEERMFKLQAEAAGLTVSEWCRQALLRAALCKPDTRFLLSELLALRAVFLTLHLEALNGNGISEERLKQFVEKAEREKFAMADKRIHSYRSQELFALTAKGIGAEE